MIVIIILIMIVPISIDSLVSPLNIKDLVIKHNVAPHTATVRLSNGINLYNL